jgi:hypothetical protein
MDLWQSLMTTGFGVLLGLPAGAYLNRRGIRYEQRARSVTEIRTKLHDIHIALLHWSAPYWKRYSSAESRYAQGGEVNTKIRELGTYYESQKPWLESRTRDVVEAIRKQIDDYYIDLMGAAASTHLPEVPSDENDAARRVYEWVGGAVAPPKEFPPKFPPGSLPALLAKFDTEVDRVLGTHPWWRKWFGGRS